MAKQRSKTVSEALARMYAKMANASAKKAIDNAACPSLTAEANHAARNAEVWMEKASAAAVRWYFSA